MERRAFVKLCSSSAALLSTCPQLLWASGAAQTTYSQVELVDKDGQPFSVDSLSAGRSFIFHYPYISTPVLLLDLGRKVEGGVGPSGGIVAFTAICPHQFSYPTANLSALNFQPGESSTAGRKQAITCCLHGSAFDPAKSGTVIAGPAPQALTVVTLEYDAGNRRISATGTHGADIYPMFFRSFKRELRKQYGRSGYKQETEGKVKVMAATEYSSQQVNC